MGDNWDDDDFEPDISSLAPPPAPLPEPVNQSTNKPAAPKKKEISMESLGRELTAAEREEIQRRSDLKMARDMFGLGDDESGETQSYDDIITKEEFEEWGAKVGTFLAKRHKAAHYGDLINKLILAVSDKLEATEIRKISNNLKTLADSKKDEKPKGPSAAGGKKKPKAQLKGAGTKGNDFDDYGGGGGGSGKYDAYDDYDDFM